MTPADTHSVQQPLPSGRWALGVTAVLMAVFVAIGAIQAHQIKLIDSTVYYTEDNISWIFSQLELEYVALRDSLRQAQRYPHDIDAEALRERYEIFVSRTPLVQPERISSMGPPQPEHLHTVGLIKQFIRAADPYLSENATSTLKPEVIAQLLSKMQPLATPIHDMSLSTTEVMGRTISNRNAAAREQGHMSIALNIFQGLLTLTFAVLLIRQVRSLENRSQELGRARDEILRLNGDLEERVHQRTAQLEAANQELEAFSYSVSHDLRSPLKTINGFSHLLERAVADQAVEKTAHYLSRIRAGTRQMGELIDGLLSLAKLSRESLQWREVDLSALARRVVQDCKERDADRQVQVQIQDGMLAQGDARLLSVVIENLVGNAWKFTSRRESAHIEIGSQAGAANETVFFVKDDGVGFDMAYADKLFSTFERLYSPSDFSGTGIGLATVKRVIERHAGRVWAQGKENEGATFYFTLGVADVSASP